MPSLNDANLEAIFALFSFWFKISWNVALLIAMFRSIKYIFNHCSYENKFQLLNCKLDSLEDIGYGDLVKVWRRWLMLLIWLIGGEMIFSLAFTLLFTNMTTLFEWFNIYWLFSFTVIGGFFSFLLLPNRCRLVRVVQC
jgi:hypothetical protein